MKQMMRNHMIVLQFARHEYLSVWHLVCQGTLEATSENVHVRYTTLMRQDALTKIMLIKVRLLKAISINYHTIRDFRANLVDRKRKERKKLTSEGSN